MHNLEKKRKLRAELENVQLYLSTEPPPYQNEIGSHANAATTNEKAKRSIRSQHGAYATGKVVVPEKSDSDGSSSVVLSSLHSSEMSDISYSEYSKEPYSDESFRSERTSCRESRMEQGEGSCSNSSRGSRDMNSDSRGGGNFNDNNSISESGYSIDDASMS